MFEKKNQNKIPMAIGEPSWIVEHDAIMPATFFNYPISRCKLLDSNHMSHRHISFRARNRVSHQPERGEGKCDIDMNYDISNKKIVNFLSSFKIV